MTENFLQILAIIAIFSINAIKSESSIAALKRILNELNTQTTSDDRYDDINIAYKPRYYKHGKSRHHDKNSPNLMNVQTMNLYVKPNKRQREEEEIKRLLRTDEERMCRVTGRCGCTGSRCNPIKADDNVADEVNRLVSEINTQLARDDYDLRNDRYREYDRDDERKTEIEQVFANFERINGRDIDDVRNNDNQDIVEDRDVRDKRLQCIGHKCFDKDENDDDLIKSQRIKISDDVDVVILDKASLERLLRNKDFIDLTRNDVDKNNEDQEIFKKVLSEYKKFLAFDDRTGPHRSSNDITPEDLNTNYEIIKKQIILKVLDFVKNNRPLNFSKIKHLTMTQKLKLKNIKTKYKRGEIEEGDVEEEVIRIIFGEDSNIKIFQHNINSNHIYLPKWIYDIIITSKKNPSNDGTQVSNDLRIQKRILPLTSQQRERLFNKEKAKTIPKLVWRKNLGQDVQKFGIPFDFEIHGLGQMAP